MTKQVSWFVFVIGVSMPVWMPIALNALMSGVIHYWLLQLFSAFIGWGALSGLAWMKKLQL